MSGVLVMNLFSAQMTGQIRQIGMMKAIGAQKMQVMGIYFGSALILSTLALTIAVPVSIAVGRLSATFLSRFLNFDLQSYAISTCVFALQGAVGFLVPLLASAYPVWNGSRAWLMLE